MNEAPEPRRRLPWRAVLTVVVTAYSVAFILLNDDRVEINFVAARAETSLVFLVVASMLLGALLTLIPYAWLRRRRG